MHNATNGIYAHLSLSDGQMVLLLRPLAGSVTVSEFDEGSILSRSNRLMWDTAFLKTIESSLEFSCNTHLFDGNSDGIRVFKFSVLRLPCGSNTHVLVAEKLKGFVNE
ncbi:MAG: hypothetical protein P8J37_12990 [Fuerstiella sp.]|nr:hypothetical protein [Fuerstiella sp.]